MSKSPIYIDLDELSLLGGERFEQVYALDLVPLVLGGQEYELLAPDGVDVTIDRINGGYLVQVSLQATLYGPCERCLTEAVLRIDAEEQEFVPTTMDEWDEADMSPFIEDFVVDVNGLAREAVMMALPSQVVCSADCPGLCPVCGHDLNTGQCGCPADTIDERLSVLKDIKFEE